MFLPLPLLPLAFIGDSIHYSIISLVWHAVQKLADQERKFWMYSLAGGMAMTTPNVYWR